MDILDIKKDEKINTDKSGRWSWRIAARSVSVRIIMGQPACSVWKVPSSSRPKRLLSVLWTTRGIIILTAMRIPIRREARDAIYTANTNRIVKHVAGKLTNNRKIFAGCVLRIGLENHYLRLHALDKHLSAPSCIPEIFRCSNLCMVNGKSS